MNLNKKVAVLGLGIEGKDLVRYLLDKGYDVTVHDKKSREELDASDIPQLDSFVTGANYLAGLDRYDVVYRSPGIYPKSPELSKLAKSKKLSSAVKVFFDECPAKIIGVTGTKGKGTTSTLVFDILKADGRDVYLAGNIGTPYLSLLPKLHKDSWVVLELSSFQLMDLEKSPHVAVVLNISTDHLDWHKDRNEYIKAKTPIVRYQSNEDIKIINDDYVDSKSFSFLGSAKAFYFSRKNEVEGSFVQDKEIIISTNGQREFVGSTDNLLLRGEHNWENVTAAIAAANAVNAPLRAIKTAVFSFKGLEHRLELVREVGGVTFYNDSFATGPDTVRAATASFAEPLTLILGGFDKGLDYQEMSEYLSNRKNINVVLIGDIADRIEKNLHDEGFLGVIKNIGKVSMKEIVDTAKNITPNGGVIVLSPGTSSFDMFESYKDRGMQFKKEVGLLV